MELMTDIVNGILIATGKGGEDPKMPWATVVFKIETDDLIDCEWYFTEEDARIGHANTVAYFSDECFRKEK